MHKQSKYIIILLLSLFANQAIQGQDSSKTTYFPYNYSEVGFYTIYTIDVTGAKHFNPLLVKLYSNLSINQEIKIPGKEIPKAIENLWKQGLFSDVKIAIDTIIGDKVALNIIVKERNKLSGFYINGLDRSEARSLREELLLKKDIIITKELKVRSENTVRNYFQEKGYYDVSVDIKEYKDTVANYNYMRIFVNKGKRVKIEKINFHGNQQITSRELRKAMKKTKQLHKKINIFASSKFISDEFENDKKNLMVQYSDGGYRDAYIVTDSIRKSKPNRIVLDIFLHEGQKYYYRNINFIGNSKYRTGVLDTVLAIKKGDVYNPSLLSERLYYSPSGYDISSIYMDDGYLFFNVTPMEVAVEGDSIDIDIRISEGKRAYVNKVEVIGNTKTSDFVILRELRTVPGNKFSRTDIQRSIQEINRLGYFDPEGIGVEPKPNANTGTVDITYTVTEKPSDQIELSGGWGGNGGYNPSTGQFNSGIVGTLGLSLTNFSTRKLLHKNKPGNAWDPLPAGDGQRLTLRAQSNGISFQTYTFSFSEPWMGGKKPNSFSFSANHSINNWGAFSNTSQKFSTTNLSVGLGKRLKWPDDFFSLNVGLSYIRYNLDNFSFGIPNFIENGNSNAIELRLGLGRYSTDDQIFPTTGSSIDVSLQATPPISLLSGKDYTTLDPAAKFKWIEYHKWKFNAAHYSTLKKNLVLASSVRFGLVGSYNDDLGITGFERFWVGGNALQGFNLAGREFISQRGYGSNAQGMISENAISNEFPNTRTGDLGSTIYNRFTMELRYAISKGQSATIYPLVFFEAGNAWINPRNFNPFELKKSVGAGVRFFLPMFGLIGIDYGYGLDINSINPSLTNGQKGYVHFFLGPQF
ncbi:BamA/TamA family outer membrane protein [Bacteroidia bacterium]|jgi:outer membrane protein insertion porin family|nr:BamA/TamA family outer membrane protein [Bacteroidia bacterium]